MIQRFFEEADRLNSAYKQFLVDICGISSKSDDKPGVDRVCDYCESFAAGMGYAVVREKIKGSGDVMSATLNPNAEGKPVCLSAHMDTVHPKDSFGITERGDILVGPGVYDCKGGIAVSFLVLETLRNCGYTSRPVKVILQSDEEVQSLPSDKKTVEFMCREAAGAQAFINCEGRVSGSITTSRKGILRYMYDITGIPVHAGTYFGGASAVREAAYKIIELESRSKEGGITYNCGIVEGGTVMNTVPAACRVYIDIRVRTSDDVTEAEKTLYEVGNRVFVPGTVTRTLKVSSRPPMERTPANANLFAHISAAAEKHGLGSYTELFAFGGSDAAYTTIAGIPTVDDLGPLGGDYHTESEWISVRSLSESAKIIIAYLLEN